MDTKLIDEWTENTQVKEKNQKENILEYYVEAGPDYEGWSRGFNMHFGYYNYGMNPFDLESMLDEMNKEVLDRLQLSNYKNNDVLDMGFGLGATIRYALNRYPIKRITGITIVPWQVNEAKQRFESEFHSYKAKFELEDFQQTSYADSSYDGIYAIESSCYAKGTDKKIILKEIYRLLKPGKRFVIADGYIKKNDPLNPIFKYCYRKMCKYWAIDNFGNISEVYDSMEELGFEDIQIEEISWRIAPSVMYVPLVALKYLFMKLLPGGFIHKQRWHHFMAPLYGLTVGASRKNFGYYLISARK